MNIVSNFYPYTKKLELLEWTQDNRASVLESYAVK